MALAVWLLFGFALGVLFTASALSYFARNLIKAIGNDIEQTLTRLDAEN